MPKIDKEDYEGKMLLKPKSKKNPTGATDGEKVTVTEVEKISMAKTESWVLTFKEHEEGLAMNKTNLKMMVDLFGDDTDDWIGQKLKLIVILANNPQTGKETPTIRVKRKDWNYGDDEGENIPEKDDGTVQPSEPDDDEEAKIKKINERRRR